MKKLLDSPRLHKALEPEFDSARSRKERASGPSDTPARNRLEERLNAARAFLLQNRHPPICFTPRFVLAEPICPGLADTLCRLELAIQAGQQRRHSRAHGLVADENHDRDRRHYQGVLGHGLTALILAHFHKHPRELVHCPVSSAMSFLLAEIGRCPVNKFGPV